MSAPLPSPSIATKSSEQNPSLSDSDAALDEGIHAGSVG